MSLFFTDSHSFLLQFHALHAFLSIFVPFTVIQYTIFYKDMANKHMAFGQSLYVKPPKPYLLKNLAEAYMYVRCAFQK